MATLVVNTWRQPLTFNVPNDKPLFVMAQDRVLLTDTQMTAPEIQRAMDLQILIPVDGIMNKLTTDFIYFDMVNGDLVAYSSQTLANLNFSLTADGALEVTGS
jgi:hypothetical protein